MSKHTQEPWQVHHDIDAGEWPMIMSGGVVDGKIIANVNPKSFCCVGGDFVEMPSADNARRIVACVNACAGMRNDELEGGLLIGVMQSKIDRLECQRDKLLDAMRQTLAMLRVTSHGPSAANKAEDMLHAAICSIGTSHSPDAGKMVSEGWQLVPVEPTSAMLIASGSTAPRYQAMLAAAPKHEGGAS